MNIDDRAEIIRHHPAAFINAISEEGSKAEAIEWLQKTWNEACELRAEIELLRALVEAADELYASLAGLEQTKGQREAMAEYAQLRYALAHRTLEQKS